VVEELSAPKSVALGAVYATLDRLEDKGLVSSWLSDPTPERGGRSKRHYQLEPDGKRALRDSVQAARRICEAVAEIWGPEMEKSK
jgi:DNA-binding PadR family transcriptional regulator